MNVVYGGFWRRWLALLIDAVLAVLVLFPLLHLLGMSADIRGTGHLIKDASLNIPFMVVAALLIANYGGTPGKRLLGMRVVDADTLQPIGFVRALWRQFAYFFSFFLFLGFIWVALSDRKRGWHDLLAGTVVIRDQGSN